MPRDVSVRTIHGRGKLVPPGTGFGCRPLSMARQGCLHRCSYDSITPSEVWAESKDTAIRMTFDGSQRGQKRSTLFWRVRTAGSGRQKPTRLNRPCADFERRSDCGDPQRTAFADTSTRAPRSVEDG